MKAFLKRITASLLAFMVTGASLVSFSEACGPSSDILADVSQPELTIPTLDEVECKAFCVYDRTAGEIILSRNPKDQVYPASMTKVMTIQLGMDYLDPDSYLTVSQNALDNVTSDSTLMYLLLGEQVKVSELYYGMMLPSGNDAANVVAEGVIDALFAKYPAGSDSVGPDGVNASYFEEELGMTSQEILYDYKLTAFAALMNLRAKNLGCTGTHFVNPNGLHNDDHYTTAYDLTLIMANASDNPDFNTVIGASTHIFESTNLHTEDGWSIVKNTNNLLNDPWLATKTAEGEDTHLTAFIGGKTGTTSMAGTGMVVYTVNENGHELYISVCGIPDHAYQTRYVASVTAYGNLACWESDPQTVIPGTTGDYRRFNSTTAELPQYDPLIIPGDELKDYLTGTDVTEPSTPEETEPTDETEPTESAVPEDDSGKAGNKTKKASDSALVIFIKENLLLSGVVDALVTMILICLIALIVRGVKNSRKRKARKKVRPFKDNPLLS